MPATLRELTDYLVALGTDKVPHSDTPFLTHLLGVYRDLKRWDCPEPLALAGLFHSIYGTATFQGFSVPWEKRAEIRGLIGEPAERLAYLNCAMDRDSFDAAVAAGDCGLLRSRLDGRPLALSEQEFTDLMTLHLCDWLEQVERTPGQWDWRRATWQRLAQRLGGAAQRRWEEVFANAP